MPIPDPIDAGCPGPGLASDGFILFDSDVQSLVPHIFAVRADGCVVVQLTSGSSGEQEPSVSPDGTTLLYTSGTPDAGSERQIYAMNLATKAVRQITTQAGGAGEATFSPDGSTILYSASGNVYLVNADGTGTHAVLTGPAEGGYPVVYEHAVFTPDGQAIVADGQNIVQEYGLDGSYLNTIVPNATTDELYPVVSPSDATLAFVMGCNGAIADSLAITPMAGSTIQPCGDRVLATAPGGGLNRPTWGPRGMIAFSRPAVNGAQSIAIVDTSDAPHDLAPDGGRQMNPFWAPSTFQPQ